MYICTHPDIKKKDRYTCPYKAPSGLADELMEAGEAHMAERRFAEAAHCRTGTDGGAGE